MTEAREKKGSTLLFPVSKQAVDLSLQQIQVDPWRAMIDEGKTERVAYPLSSLIIHHFRNNPLEFNSVHGDYEYGAMTAHRIFRLQAEQNGTEVPRLQGGVLDHQYPFPPSTHPESPDYNKELAVIADEDPEFTRAISEVTKYNPSRWLVTAGMIDVYKALKGDLYGDNKQFFRQASKVVAPVAPQA